MRIRGIAGGSAGVAALAGLGLGLGACGSSPTGYHVPATLRASIIQQLDKQISNPNYGYNYGQRVTQVILVPTGPNTDIAHVQDNQGDSATITVHISPDGKSWVSSPTTWYGPDYNN